MAVLEPQKNAYYRLYSINRGGNPGELPLPLVGLHSPPPRVSSQPLGGLLERPCVSLCAYRLRVFSSRYRIKGFFCARLFQILNNPTQVRCMLQYFFPFVKCFSVSHQEYFGSAGNALCSFLTWSTWTGTPNSSNIASLCTRKCHWGLLTSSLKLLHISL